LHFGAADNRCYNIVRVQEYERCGTQHCYFPTGHNATSSIEMNVACESTPDCRHVQFSELTYDRLYIDFFDFRFGLLADLFTNISSMAVFWGRAFWQSKSCCSEGCYEIRSKMPTFLQSGRSDGQKSGEINVRFRPEAAVSMSRFWQILTDLTIELASPPP